MSRRATSEGVRRIAWYRRLRSLPLAESCDLAADLAADLPEVFERVDVLKLLENVHLVGPSRIERMLEAAAVNATTRLGDLSPVRRGALIASLRFQAAMARESRRVRESKERYRREHEQWEARASGKGRLIMPEHQGPRCQACGEPMQEPSPDGRCNFCVFEDRDRHATTTTSKEQQQHG